MKDDVIYDKFVEILKQKRGIQDRLVDIMSKKRIEIGKNLDLCTQYENNSHQLQDVNSHFFPCLKYNKLEKLKFKISLNFPIFKIFHICLVWFCSCQS